jgi:two-component system, NarL family, sensor kinase
MRCFRVILIFCTMLRLGKYTAAQSTTIDSLLKLLQVAKTDTEKIALNYELEATFVGYDLQKASYYLENGSRLARAIKSPYFISKYYHMKASLRATEAKYAEALKICDSAITLSKELSQKKINDKYIFDKCQFDIAQTLTTKGLVYAKQYEYNESVKCYVESIKMFEKINDPKNNTSVARIYTSISSNYYELDQYQLALEYDKRALQFLDQNKDVDLFVVGHLFVADDYSSLSQFDSSFHYLDKVRPVVEQLNKPNLNVRFHYILGGIYRKRKQWKEALDNFQQANLSAKINGDDFQILNSAEGIAASYLELGDLDKAKTMATFALNESSRLKVAFIKIQALQLLIKIEERSGNIAKAYQYQTQYVFLNDSLNKEKIQRQMHETETRYQSEKKQNEIVQLEKDKQIQSLSIHQKSTLNYILFGSLAILSTLGFLSYRTYRQKQKLQQQKIIELEKDKQLTVVDAMLKGQEEERSRLAKELHDGLGGLLSGVKYSLNNMKDNLIVTPDNMAVFERSLDMIDTSIKELRRVAHNMMPEMLAKFGLDEALKEYTNSIAATKLLTVKYQSFGMKERVENSSEIIIYRIVQELLNNVLKHASASEVLIQLIREENRLNVLVEDNGKGFDTALLENSKGAGWTNIRSRVDYLKGQLDIHSDIGKGTSISIEFNL